MIKFGKSEKHKTRNNAKWLTLYIKILTWTTFCEKLKLVDSFLTCKLVYCWKKGNTHSL